MATFTAYALNVVGIPILVGMLVGLLISLPITLIGKFRGGLHILFKASDILEFFDGVGAILVAILIFRLLGVTLTIFVPFIIVLEISCYFWIKSQSRVAWCSWLVGIGLGWFTIPRFL
jgi:hypothetical protein